MFWLPVGLSFLLSFARLHATCNALQSLVRCLHIHLRDGSWQAQGWRQVANSSASEQLPPK
jgi:hypothetical protein